MGYEQKDVRVMAVVSRHNSPRDAEDAALWAEMVSRLREVCDDPRYARLNVMADGLSDD